MERVGILVKLCDVIPCVLTVALGEVYSVLIQWMNDSTKPNPCNVYVIKKVQFTWLNAFSASRETIIVLVWVCCARLIMLNNLHKLSEPCFFLINPVWSGCIRVEITVSNLIARALVIIVIIGLLLFSKVSYLSCWNRNCFCLFIISSNWNLVVCSSFFIVIHLFCKLFHFLFQMFF